MSILNLINENKVNEVNVAIENKKRKHENILKLNELLTKAKGLIPYIKNEVENIKNVFTDISFRYDAVGEIFICKDKNVLFTLDIFKLDKVYFQIYMNGKNHSIDIVEKDEEIGVEIEDKFYNKEETVELIKNLIYTAIV